jgi:YesN/AraC family two-component response regulator
MKKKLLLVDEDISIGEDFKSAFSKEIAMQQYEIILCHKPEDALEIIGTNQIDLLITDIYFREALLGGWELIKALKEKDIFLKTVILASYVSYESRIKALKENVISILEKPVLFVDLKIYIKFLLSLDQRKDVLGSPVELKNFLDIYEASINLPQNLIVKLINKLLDLLNLKNLNKINTEKNIKLRIKREQEKEKEQQEKVKAQKRLEQAKERYYLKNKFLEKYNKGEINLKIDIEKIGNFSVSKTYNKGYGPYYSLHYWDEGKTQSIYLGKNVLD